MAFKPWILSSSHIEYLTKGDEKDSNTNWSIPQIIQAGAVLGTYHSLCGLVFGQGIIESTDIAMTFEKT